MSKYRAIAIIALLTAMATMNVAFSDTKRLNNLVIEIYSKSSAAEPISFSMPRPGWVSINLRSISPSEAQIHLISRDGSIVHALGSASSRIECMRWLEAGSHALQSDGSKPLLLDATLRIVPEMHFCRFPIQPKIPEFGRMDWSFLEQCILPYINTLVGNPSPDSEEPITKWTSKGGKWIGYYHLPHQQGLTGQQAFEFWANHPGFQDPRLSGLIADEFQGRQNAWYPAWIEGMKLLGDSSVRTGRAFYGYCGGPAMHTRPQTREMVRTIFDQGFYMAYERYLHEEPTLEAMHMLMDRLLGTELPKWRKTFPGCEQKMVMVLGLFAQGMGLNVCPDVDFKVHMDLQMQYLASRDAFKDIFGIHWWVADYADEELIAWLGQLYRHYGIEGRTDLLSEQYGYAYQLDHVRNPDFQEGFTGWRIEPADITSMRTDYMERLAQIQGRYWHRGITPDEPSGNTFLWMQRQRKQPNRASQAIRNLVPGRTYSAKMISADFRKVANGISEEKQIPVALEIYGAEIIAEKTFQAAYSGQLWEPFREKPACFNLHRVVFRATAQNAALLITDWPDGAAPIADEEAESMVNFVEVQPYFELTD